MAARPHLSLRFFPDKTKPSYYKQILFLFISRIFMAKRELIWYIKYKISLL